MHAVVRAGRDRGRWLIVDYVRWLVFELIDQYDRRGPSLTFESEHVVRRVRGYPRDWRQLADDDLVRLMERA